MVLAGHIGIEASVVLFEIAGGRVGYVVQGNIRSVGESTADAGRAGVHVGEVLLAKASGQRRTNVQALTRNGIAGYAFREAGLRAGCRANHGARNCSSLEVEEGGGDTVCWR